MDLFAIEPQAKVLAIFAHPDDAETAAGGTLAQYAIQGAKVDLITVALGDKGFGELADREQESKEAISTLGLNSYQSLGYADGEFDNDLILRKTLTEHIRSYKPDVVICPDPTSVFFSHLYINHRDHRITGWAVIDVVSSAVSNPKYFSASKAHKVSHLLCAGTLEPNCAVDITNAIETKVAGVLCHKSQIAQNVESTVNAIKQTSLSVGKEVGVKYAEAFRYCSIEIVES